MTNNELKKILKWASEKGSFTWYDLQQQFGYDNKKMTQVQRILRSNMPITSNLIDRPYINGEDSNKLVITTNGLSTLANLKDQRSRLYNFFHNPWVVGLGAGLVLLIISAYLGLK